MAQQPWPQTWDMDDGWTWEYERQTVLEDIRDREAQIAALREYLIWIEGMHGEDV